MTNKNEVLKPFLATMNEMQAEDIVVLDLRSKTVVFDYFIIVTAKNQAHCKAIFDIFIQQRKQGKKKFFYSSVCDSSDSWRILDYEDVMVHIFLEPMRKKYDLESLWTKEYVKQDIEYDETDDHRE